MIGTVIVSLGCLLLAYLAFIHESRTVRLLKKFPGPKPLFILGNAMDLTVPENVMSVFSKWRDTFGSRFRVFIGTSILNVVFTSPQDLQKLLTSNDVLEKADGYSVISEWLGDGVFLSTGQKWRTRRKQLIAAFNFKILETFLVVFNSQAQVFVDIIKTKFVGSKEPVEVTELVTRCALDIICETAMGTKLNCQRDLTNEFADATIKESTYAWSRWTAPWYHSDFVWSLSRPGRVEKANIKILHDFTNQVIQERKATFERERMERQLNSNSTENQNESEEQDFFSSKRKFAFLDQLLQIQADNPAELSDEDIRAETDTFMFGGHDTVAAAISWTIFLLALYPEEQAGVHTELDSIFGDDRDRPMTTADLTKMKYLEYCLKESLRLYPSGVIMGRKVTQDFHLDDGAIVPKGAGIVFIPYITHRDPKIFPQPEEFRPSRFFPENCNGRHPYAYIPFSAGPRNCIGQRFAQMEGKTVLAHLFRSFRVETTDTRESVQPLPELIMRPKNGIHVKFFAR